MGFLEHSKARRTITGVPMDIIQTLEREEIARL